MDRGLYKRYLDENVEVPETTRRRQERKANENGDRQVNSDESENEVGGLFLIINICILNLSETLVS